MVGTIWKTQFTADWTLSSSWAEKSISTIYADIAFKNHVYKEGLNAVFKKVNKANPNKAQSYRRYLQDYRATIFNVDQLDFAAAHQKALGSLLHPDYIDRLN